ncbi:replication restart helicase PriA [Anaeromyxobacter dehalogenans]|uniref:Replication restart protein PriA n=1 Tax=Anaeromyxobacter dehalogenans (strain 2CP-C) TaxID=290397 RepID=Q2INW7_ANADE|nr:primosomal protein N' [Anaeromyxobacter dehalogenans]ABC80502.1 replication restart DNA helicase PriA [Anaeromyxobacter dehalogenans 2CP-C]
MLVEVAVAAAVRGTFTYRVPSSLASEVALGQRVAVPFGRSRRATGYVVGFPAAPPEGFELRDVVEVLDPFPPFTPKLVELLRWAEEYYLVPPGELLRAALPPGLNARRGAPAPARRGVEYAAPAPDAAASLGALGRAAAQRAVLEYLLARGRIPVEELRAAFPRGRPALSALAKRGLVTLETETPVATAGVLPASAAAPAALTPAQAAALAEIDAAAGTFQAFLLHGVTGSGKTEVYLQAIARARAAGRGALVLVPEIALTPQLSGRFRARFGDDVALLHSGLSDAERHAEWLRLRRGEARICVGVRSAIFAPVQDLAVLVVDEEHDGSFKQEDGPPYHARDLAVVRAKREDAVLILGSATPSLETLENARRGRYRKLDLPARVDDRPMPEVELVDLSKLRRAGVSGLPGLLSPRLAAALEDTLAAGQQAILFLNRRGYETLVVCEVCGAEAGCPDCSVSLTHHARRGVLMCHYCGRTEPMSGRCAACGGVRFGVGVGTEQVEEAVRALLPRARVARLDRDVVSSADDTAAVLARFARRDADVLVGTQMVTKGHDFPGVTLVGVVLADTALALPDFRAAERTFQLLTQVAGRAGRGAEAGRVIVQTFNPATPAVALAATHDYAAFAEGELERRRAFGYPPFGRMMAARVEGTEDGARRTAEALARAARPALAGEVAMLGPAPAAIERIRGKSRWHLLFRAPSPPSLFRVHAALARVAQRPPGGAAIRFDMDPYSML